MALVDQHRASGLPEVGAVRLLMIPGQAPQTAFSWSTSRDAQQCLQFFLVWVGCCFRAASRVSSDLKF